MGPRSHLFYLLFLAVIGAIVFVARTWTWRQGGNLKTVDNWIGTADPEIKIETRPCVEQLRWLEPFQFSYPIKYVSRDIIAVASTNSERPPLSIVDEPLFEEFVTIDLAKSTQVEVQKCLPPVRLEVPHVNLPKVDASNMIFGLQTTMERLRGTVKHMARWLPHTNARLFAIVIDTEQKPTDSKEMAQLEKEFNEQYMNVSIIHPVRPKDSFAQRYFSLMNVMYAARDAQTEWVVLVDDDTFFPSMHDLQTLLSKYDSSKEQYIGSLSEIWWAVNHYGMMGFGGAGIMISLPLAKVIDDHTDECKENLRTTAGDITVMDCIYRFSSTKLTHVPGLHQVDMPGDVSGFYESGREMISLHHWKAGFKLEMEKMHLVADICDSCFLQRWQFGKDTVLSNGFSIAHYPSGFGKINLQEMEHTWGDRDKAKVLHSLAPVRQSVKDKMAYKLLDSVKEDCVVRQVYFRDGGGEMDTVMVLNWKSDESKKDEVGL